MLQYACIYMAYRAKKSLGQHFLRSSSVVKAMVAAGGVVPGDAVLEIGPGEGVLTEALLAAGARVLAVEKDRGLIPVLEERFADAIASGALSLVEADILDFDPAAYGLAAGQYKLVANIPYYITGAIFEKFLAERTPPSVAVMLIQKEVATRIVARDGKESILSISVKAFGTPRIAAKVSASAFRPAPKVDSAVIAVDGISSTRFQGWRIGGRSAAKDAAAAHFFTIVRAGFAHKRKLLARNLEAAAGKEAIAAVLAEQGLPPNARAEDLSLDDWLALAKAL